MSFLKMKGNDCVKQLGVANKEAMSLNHTMKKTSSQRSGLNNYQLDHQKMIHFAFWGEICL